MEKATVTVTENVAEVEPKVGDLPEEKPAAALPDEVPEQAKEVKVEEAPGNYNSNCLYAIQFLLFPEQQSVG